MNHVKILTFLLLLLHKVSILSATCHSSALPNGVSIVGPCTYQNSDVCNAQCVNNGQVLWKEEAKCLSGGQWSPLPPCHASNSLELIRCDKLTDIIQENISDCVKIKVNVRGSTSTPKAICPEILQLFVKFGNCRAEPESNCTVSCSYGGFVLHCVTNGHENCTFPVKSLCPELNSVKLINCSRVVGTFCKIRCPNGMIAAEEIQCLSTNEWSPLPLCNYRSQCAHQHLPAEVRFTNSQCKQSTAPRCKVGCNIRVSSRGSTFNIRRLVFVKDAECTSSGSWHGLPNCEQAKRMLSKKIADKFQCPKPKVPKNSVLVNKCLRAEGSVCHYKCKEGFFSTGNNIIRCFMKRWIGESICKPILCPPLPKTFHYNIACRRTIGSNCDLQCKNGTLKGNSRVSCSNSGEWSILPNCVFSFKNCTRKISSYISFVQDCSFQNDVKCQIRCPVKFALVGRNFVKCEKGAWKNIPQCIPEKISPYKILKIKCSFPPPLHANLKIIGSCNPEGGVTCDITCRDGSAYMTGPNSTTCLPPGIWSKMKPCSGGKSYCSVPKFHKHLKIVQDCSGKVIGSKCYVKCKYRPEIGAFIVCQKNLKWSSRPRCTCPSPILRENLDFRENCTERKPKEKCALACRKGLLMIGDGNIRCNYKLQWSSLPSCKRPKCVKPQLSRVLSFKEDCTSKLSGDHCKLECKEGGKLLKHSTIQCISGTLWTEQPRCACPFPFLSKGVVARNDCRKVFPGKKCFLSCKSNSFKISRNFITCNRYTRWSGTSECKRKSCPRPVLTNTLLFEEDCSSKGFGDRCHVSCKELGRPFKSNYTVCLNTMHWTPLPMCTCPIPSLPDFIETKNDCKNKLPGEHCSLICKGGMKIEGNNIIICKNNTKWSKIPNCKRNNCFKKHLPDILQYSEDCTTVTPGKKCLLECKEGGEFLGPNFIVCLFGFLWTPLPTCSCPIPNLPDDLIAIENCSKKGVGEKCHLKCREYKSLAADNFIICQNNTRWSHVPKCKKLPCLNLRLPNHLGFKKDCSSKYPGEFCQLMCKAGGKIIGSHTVQCIKGKKWTKLPDCTCPSPKLRNQLILIEKCSTKRIGQKCRLKCKFDPTLSNEKHIFCKKNGQWSPLPKCKLRHCTLPKLPKTLVYANNCFSLVPGKACFVQCKEGGKLIGSNKIFCNTIKQQRTFPRCTCPLPLLTKDLSMTERCSHKTEGEKCHVTCRKPFLLVGKGFIICKEDTRWSPSPQCLKLACPKIKLSSPLKFLENCSSKVLGEKCRLQCREGGSLIGSYYITCKIHSRLLYWTSFPQCTCSNPMLPEDLKPIEDCSKKKSGQTCNLKCSTKRKVLPGNKFIWCQANTKWSVLPKCMRAICYKPTLPRILKFITDCSSRPVGKFCILGCRNGGSPFPRNYISCITTGNWSRLPSCSCPPPLLKKNLKFKNSKCNKILPGNPCVLKCKADSSIVGRNYLVCLNSSKWSIQPVCKSHVCKKPHLPPFLKLEENCLFKRIKESCKISCREGGNLMGENKVTCSANENWNISSECTCPSPTLSEELETKGYCNNTKRGEYCEVFCKKRQKPETNNFIVCQNNTKWNAQPKCVKFCPYPMLPQILVLEEDCFFKSVKESCKIRCKQGGFIIGEPVIECTEEMNWSTFPSCTCPQPVLSDHVKEMENCSKKVPKEICKIKCKPGWKFSGKNYLVCENNTKWSAESKCILKNCPKPVLTDNLDFGENCTLKYSEEKCHVKCKENGRIIGKEFIVCKFNGSWTSLPDCSCPLSKLESSFRHKEHCGFQTPGQKCILECEIDLKLKGPNFILCQNNSKWSSRPKCIKTVCPNLVLQGDLLVLKEVCSAKTIGDKCQVGCKNGGNLITGKEMECLKDFQWSKPPDCTCANPNVSESIQLITQCDSIPKREKCFVRCKSGYDIAGISYATCQNNGKWGAFPSCLKKSCPEPALSSSMLKVKAECSKKFFQDACIVTCREGGQLIGEAEIKCEYTGQWSSLPHCACPIPIPSNDLILTNCSTKLPGENCFAECRKNFKLIGDAFLLCQKNTKWSIMPKCIPKICPSPYVPEYLEIRKNCSSKKIGEFCEVSCKHGGKVTGTNTTQCLPTTAWSSLPDCTCPVPKITQSLVTLQENCNFKKRYEHCAVGCPEGYAIQTEGAFACLPNATWSSLPLCVKTHCSLPTLDREILKEEEDCTFKKIGDTCRVQCVQGGRLLVPKNLTCLRGGNWSSVPRCTCPILTISNDLRVLKDCNDANPGFQCFVECKETLKLNGKNYILCMNNSKWSVQPKCVKTVCPNLVLQGDLLVLKEVCSAKTFGDKCQVGCKNGGNLITGKEMECLKDFQWSKPPDCTCANPNVSESIQLITQCDSTPKREKCFVRCKSGYDIAGISYATCQNNGKWGAFPSCLKKSCPEPALSSSMLKVKAECSKKFFQDACIVTCREGGQLIGEAEIKCEYTGQWSSLPHCACPIPIPSNDLILTNCSTKLPGENCFAECRKNFKLIGDAFLLCQKNTKWSIMPKCIPKICPSPYVPEYLEIRKNCSSKKIGEFCEVSCKHGGKVTGTNTTQCLPTTAWSSLPDCTCPVPKITQSLVTLQENCNFKKRYEHCAVGCPEGYAIQTEGAFACLPNATWSSLPLCVKTHCSLPTLDREILKEEEDCTFKKIGDTCRVQCVQGGRLLVPKNLTCLRGGNWSSVPRCTCPILTISNDLRVLKDCNDANPGFQCFVECKETLKLNGKNYILCMNNSKWSVQPKCVKTVCPNLVLQGDLLVLKEVCSAKTFGDKCQVGCKNGGNLITGKEMECLKDFQWSKPPDCTCANPNVSESIQLITQCDSIPKREKCFVRCKSGYDIAGISYATCQNNGKWGAFPSCLKKSCPEPALSSSMLKVKAECSKKFFQDACIVTCREGGQLIGEAEIKCEYTGQWSSLPHCACPIPIPSNDLILTNCSTKLPGENCFAECRKNFKLIGDAFLLCQKNTKWSIMPKCIHKICPSPYVPEYLEIKKNCSFKKIGEFCEVSCKHGGKVTGTNTTQCLPTTAWSSLPDCTCPVPKITQSLVTLQENCNFKKRYEHCAVGCPEGYAIQTEGAFACLPNATWSSLPLCVKTHCSLPTLDREILKEEEDCTFKKIGDTCRVQCVQGGRLLVPKNLTCLRGGNWSSVPRCTCPILTISNDLRVLKDCNDANPGFQCFVECKETLKLNGKNYILCMNNSKWSVQPKCVKTVCPNLVLQGDLLVLKEVCSAKTIGDKCQVGCKNGGNLVTGKEMECLKDFQWSKPPDCTCANPNVSESIQLITQCDSIPKREKCFVRCKSGYDIAGISYATCQNNGKWGAFPSCLKKSCPEPALSSSMLKVKAECSKKFFQDACIVTCREGGQLIGEAEIKCEYTGQWSSLPHCACPIPIPSNDLILTNCSTKLPGENCFAECRKNFKLIGDAFLLCQKNTKWSIMPKCIHKICPSPYVPEYLEIKKNCSFKKIGEFCEVSCKHGGKVTGTNTTQCLPTTAWSSLPDCTCPVPKITQSLVTLQENCNFKKRYEHCAVGCPEGYAIQTEGAFACLPNATWSSLPLCVKTHCSLPTLDREILKEEEDCTFKKIGDTCRVQCVQGGRLLVPKNLTCLRGGNWSSVPRCTCPILTISNDLRVLKDCNDANPGFQCFVECKETLKLNGKNYILCMNNSKWSVQPKCVKTVCPNLVLQGDLLVLKEVCSAKTIGDKCQVGCKNGGNLITGKEMECLKDFQWSKPPDCTCANPNVSESIQLITQCDSIPKREKCFVRCKSGYDIAGISYATCQNNGKWGAFPSCLKKSCPEPALSSSMLKVKAECSKKFFQDACIVTCREGGQLIGEAEIKCEYTSQWSSLPHCACPIPIPSNDLILTNCSTKLPGENCFAECRKNFKLIGDAFLLCQKNTKWSIMPKCIHKICPSPYVPEYLEIKKNCSFKKIGEFCEVSCKHGGKVTGTNTTQCLPTTAWSSLPDCTCPVPKITQSLVTLQENCNFKKRYEHCAVGCPEGYAIQTEGAFACLPNATWSSLPLCVKTHCSLPTLDREILKEEEDCTFKKIGDTCRVQCVQGGRLLVPKNLTCLRGGNWSSVPRCTCPILTISNDLRVLKDCNDANPGFQCFVECKETLKLNGKNYILCMNNSKWSVQPKCVKTVCPNLVLQGDLLVLKEVCSAKTIGDKCQVGCKNGGNLITGKEMECLKDFQWSKPPDCTCANPNVSESIQLITQCDSIPKREKCFVRCKSGYDIAGISYATCQNNGKWGAFPSCLKKSCPEPALSSSMLKVKAECSKKFFQDACIVTCREGGQLIGEAEIKCEYTGQWSSLPHCACPIPIPSNDLILTNCSTKLPGENCFAECRKNFKLIGDAFLLCQKNTKWSIMPKCIHKICPSPYVPEYLEIKKNCSFKKIGEFCEVSCKHGGKVTGTNTTQCLPTTAWSSLPDCTCPVPKITQSLVTLQENCNFKKRYEHCAVGCPEGYAIQTEGAFACLPNATWSSLPLCVKTHCSLPTLDREILKEEEDCTFKKIGDTCRVQCVQGGRLLVPKNLTCLRGGNWSSVPRCTCPILTISNDLRVLKDCNDANPGFQCFVECKETLKLNGKNYILCMNNSKWSVQPKCVKMVCPNLVLQGDLLVLKEVCSAKTIGDKCQVGCKNGGNLITGKEMECLKDFQWSKPPDCTCANPNVSESIQLITQCDSIPKREKCFVRCKSGYDIAGISYATCQNNGKWGAFPSCLKKSCPEPALSSSMLKVKAECSKKFFQDACIVTCREGGQLIGEAEIKCEYTGQWSSLPHCACPIPIPSNDLILHNCSPKIPGENCFAECKEKLKRIGDSFLLCQKNTKWSIMPKCIPKICPSPNIPEYLEIKRNCSSKKTGEVCEVSCKHGGTVSGSFNVTNALRCLESLKWSSPPRCTCLLPEISESVGLKHFCSLKLPGEQCFIFCKIGYKLVGPGNSTCQNNARWGPLPFCMKVSCPDPVRPSTAIRFLGNCIGKLMGEDCDISCAQGGDLLGGEYIKCLNTRQWSPFPICSCPAPDFPAYLKSTDSCTSIMPGLKCDLECENNLKLVGNKYISCQKDSKWSAMPKCVKINCPEPVFEFDFLKFEEGCAEKSVGETCKLGCKEKGQLIGNTSIECLKNLRWSTFPDCSCPLPNVTDEFEILENCSLKLVYEVCHVKCKFTGGNNTNSLKCQENRKWTSLPSCAPLTCNVPLIPDYLQSIGSCSSLKVKQLCDLRCKGGGIALERNYIMCLEGGIWSPIPNCSCPLPDLKNGLDMKTYCSRVAKLGVCTLICKPTKAVYNITCQNNLKWSAPPKCSKGRASSTFKIRKGSKIDIPLHYVRGMTESERKKFGIRLETAPAPFRPKPFRF